MYMQFNDLLKGTEIGWSGTRLALGVKGYVLTPNYHRSIPSPSLQALAMQSCRKAAQNL
jgi:hypothetical protein